MKFFKIFAILVVSVVILAFFLLTAGYIFMDVLLFPAPHTGQKVGNMTLISGEAELDVFYFKNTTGKPVILYSHGNNEYLAKIKPWIDKFIAHGYSLLAYDYAGYGGSSGRSSEKQAISDIESAYRFLTEKEKFMPQEIIAVGYSVGSGPSSYLASRYNIKKLVLIAPFASASQVYFPWQLPFDKFKNAELMSKSKTSVLIFHGTKDIRVPYRNGKKIYDMAAGAKKLITVEGANHRNIFQKFEKDFWKELAR